MSFSNPQVKNPATKFLQWRGGIDGGGRVTYYDKQAEETKSVELPFGFTVLDELNTVTGYSEKDRSGFYGNEVRNMATDELTVRTKAGIVTRGLYGNISDEIKSKGAKYAKSVYIAFKDETGELTIGNIKISGAALTAWIDFNKQYDINKCAVSITDKPKKAKKGSNEYFVPVFEAQEISEESRKQVIQLDLELQAYLGSYLSRKPEVAAPEEAEITDEDIEIVDLPDDTDPQEEVTDSGEVKADEIPVKNVPF